VRSSTNVRCLNRLAVKQAILLQPELNQKKICRILKISEAYLSRLINEQIPLPKSDRLLNRLADILRLSPKEILDGAK
jgi:predicted XRE-type DNA-binding protein